MKPVGQCLVWFVCLLCLAANVLASDPPKPSSPPVKPPVNLKEVIVVFKTHFDIGYTDLASTIVDKYRTSMIDKALDTCEKSNDLPPEQRFSWMVPGWPLQQILWPGQTPERRERLIKALRDGRIIFHAWPCTMQTESADPEDLVRGMEFSSALARQLGQSLPRDAKMTDVPEHTWILPTIMKRAGIDFLHIGCNPGSTPPRVPLLYWWEGPDGSRLLTMYNADYGSQLMPPADWPHRTWLCMMMTGDNHGPPTAEEVKKLFAEAEKTLPGVKVRVGRLSDFYDAIMKENPKNIPVVRADMPDTWNHGIQSMPRETALARLVRPRIAALEALDTELNAWGIVTRPVDGIVKEAYEGSVMYSEHTWGMDYKKFPNLYGAAWKQALDEGKYAKFLKSLDEHRDYIRKAGQQTSLGLAERLTQLAKSVNVEGRRIVVFNPTPWPRTGTVSVAWAGPPAACLKDAASGAQVIAAVRDRLLTFTAADVPPLGYRTYVVTNEASPDLAGLAADEPAGTIENQYFKVKVDPKKGGIASIIDKRTGRELVDQASPHGLGQYLYERFSAQNVQDFLDRYSVRKDGKIPGWVYGDFGKPNLPASEYAQTGAVAAEWKIRKDARSAVATLQLAANDDIADPTELTVRLDRDAPWVDVQWRVKSKKGEPRPEAGWLCLPFNLKNPAIRLGRPGSIVDPAKDFIEDANNRNFALQTGLTLTGADGAGVGLSAIDGDLISLGEPGIWKFDRKWTQPRNAEVFVNLYNNMWNTNFPAWIDGSFASTVRIWSVEPGQSAEAALITPGLESRLGLLATVTDGPAGELPPVQAGLGVSRKGVVVTAFGPNPDGQGTILRLWEMAGEGGAVKVTLPKGFKAAKAQPVNLRGEAQGQPLKVDNGTVSVTMEKFAPLTLRF